MFKIVNGIETPLTDVEKGHRKDEEERASHRKQADEILKSSRASRKIEILEKLKISHDEWQILLQGD